MHDPASFLTRAVTAYAKMVVGNPGRVLAFLLLLGGVSGWLTTKLEIEPDQLKLISQELPEVKAVQRIVDMVGGAGYLTLAFRGSDVPAMKKVADAMAEELAADTEHVRFFTYKVPVQFIQEHMVLFIKTEDLLEGKRRIMAFLNDQIRRNSPFYVEIKKTEPVKLDLTDLIDKYSHIGQKSIRDDYYLSDESKMLIMLIKPMWTSTELPRTKEYLERINEQLQRVAQKTGIALEEGYQRQGQLSDTNKMGDAKRVFYGFTGNYKTSVDDSYAIDESLKPVAVWGFVFICVITMLFFRRWAPTVIVISGMALGTIITMGFAKVALGQLNMITSMIGGILMGFGVDYGIHFTYRTRIELGSGKRYDLAITDALIYAGRPALIAAIVTSGSFFVLLVSQFRGFSQFGLLAGFGTLIIGFTLFSWCPSILTLLGRRNPELPKKLIGYMDPPRDHNAAGGEIRIPQPKFVLGMATAVVALVCGFSIPWKDFPAPKEPTIVDRFLGGVRFNYNTRALVADDTFSIQLLDEMNERFKISSDPIAVPGKTIEDLKAVWDAMTVVESGIRTTNKAKYPTVSQVVSLYSFVPEPDIAEKNARVLEEWKKELDEKELTVASFPPELQEKGNFFVRILGQKPYGVEGVPEIYSSMFKSLKTTKPENQGYMTFIYPSVDLWDGKQMLQFNDEVRTIHTEKGDYMSAGLAMLFATLARIVLFDGKLTVLLAALWILVMHYLDFRSVKLAAASVIPLGIGLWMMLGVLSITDHKLNFMNLVILPILLGFGVSHGLYLLHRFLEGTSPIVALRSVGAAVASSTLTAVAGFASLFFAKHNGLKSIGYVACIGLLTTLVISFTVLAAVLQIIHDQRSPEEKAGGNH